VLIFQAVAIYLGHIALQLVQNLVTLQPQTELFAAIYELPKDGMKGHQRDGMRCCCAERGHLKSEQGIFWVLWSCLGALSSDGDTPGTMHSSAFIGPAGCSSLVTLCHSQRSGGAAMIEQDKIEGMGSYELGQSPS
jgi:hypothetical protein